MLVIRTAKHRFQSVLVLTLFLATTLGAQSRESVARFVLWQPKPGMSRDLEEGYKRHLEWHRKNADPWTWLGWTMISGERFGWFVDATMNHTWEELDSPVSPAADSADNAVNVFPYGDIRLAATYEAVPSPISLNAAELEAPFLTFVYLEVQPGAGRELEARFGDAFRAAQVARLKCTLLRPVNGTADYLLLIPSARTSELAAVSRFLQDLLAATRQERDAQPLVLRYRTETGRYRRDLSYFPEKR